MTENLVLLVSSEGIDKWQIVKSVFPDLENGPVVPLANKYYECLLEFREFTLGRDDISHLKDDFQSVIIIVNDSLQASLISPELLHGRDSKFLILDLDEGPLFESHARTYRNLCLDNGIEFMHNNTTLLKEEDDEHVRLRLREALECTMWKHMTRATSSSKAPTSRKIPVMDAFDYNDIMDEMHYQQLTDDGVVDQHYTTKESDGLHPQDDAPVTSENGEPLSSPDTNLEGSFQPLAEDFVNAYRSIAEKFGPFSEPEGLSSEEAGANDGQDPFMLLEYYKNATNAIRNNLSNLSLEDRREEAAKLIFGLMSALGCDDDDEGNGGEDASSTFSDPPDDSDADTSD